MPHRKTAPSTTDTSNDIILAPASSFTELGLDERVLRGIRDLGFEAPTPIQAKSLPYTLGGFDLVGQAQTGTGKTAAFLITIFQRLLKNPRKQGPLPRALIISPTRELTLQIEKEARDLGAHTGFSFAAVLGGIDYHRQAESLRSGTDIVVGTPGRLIDYLKQRTLKTDGIEILVIDEADRLLDMGFIKDLRFILKNLPPFNARQTLLFSATINFRVIEATYHYMKIPVEVSATPQTVVVDEVTHELVHIEHRKKFRFLLGLMEKIRGERALIFANTKSGVMMIKERLTENGFSASALTGDILQRKRIKLLERFMKGEITVLIATDVASRGLHIDDVGWIILYDLPQNAEDYVHRIGRTARAGKRGVAVSLVSEQDVYNIEPIEKLIGEKISYRIASDDELSPERESEKRAKKTQHPKKWGKGRDSRR